MAIGAVAADAEDTKRIGERTLAQKNATAICNKYTRHENIAETPPKQYNRHVSYCTRYDKARLVGEGE